MSCCKVIILGSLLVAGLAAQASASSIADLQILINWDGGTWSSASHPGSITTTPNGDGTYNLRFYGRVPGAWTARWTLTVDPDPFVYGLLAIRNETAATQIYQPTVVLPSVFTAGPTTMSGSMSGTVLDNTGDSASLATLPNQPMYTAKIDGVTQHTLIPDSYSCFAGAYMTNAVGPTSFSGLTGPAVTTDISLLHQFSVTAGDSATIVSSFTVTPEPATATLSLLAFGAVICRRRSRRSV